MVRSAWESSIRHPGNDVRRRRLFWTRYAVSMATPPFYSYYTTENTKSVLKMRTLAPVTSVLTSLCLVTSVSPYSLSFHLQRQSPYVVCNV